MPTYLKKKKNSIRMWDNTLVLHPPIITYHLSFFHFDSHLKKISPTPNNNFETLHLPSEKKKKKKHQICSKVSKPDL